MLLKLFLKMSDPKEYFSAEYKVFKRATDNLFVGFRCAHKQLSRLFFSKDLISNEIYDLTNDGTVDVDSSVQKMVNTLQGQVKIFPATYYSIVELLKNVTGTERLGEYLEREVTAELEKMRKMAEEQNKKLVEAQHSLHNQDDVRRRSLVGNNQSRILPIFTMEATEPTIDTTEARNMTPNEGDRSSLLENTMTPFGCQTSAQIGSTERGYTAASHVSNQGHFLDLK